MAWQIVERRIGKAGPLKRRTARQKEWDRKYGEGNWEVGYVIAGEFIRQEEALETIYYRSYAQHFQEHPSDLEELIRLGRVLRNPHAEATTSVDLQVPAILDYLRRHDLQLQGREVVDIGSWESQASHPISIRLSPLQIKVVGNAKMTLERFWQEKKCLAIWVEEAEFLR